MKITFQDMYYVSVFDSFKTTFTSQSIENIAEAELLEYYLSIQDRPL